MVCCTPGGIRTHTVSILSRVPLPLGYRSEKLKPVLGALAFWDLLGYVSELQSLVTNVVDDGSALVLQQRDELVGDAQQVRGSVVNDHSCQSTRRKYGDRVGDVATDGLLGVGLEVHYSFFL